MTEQKPEKQSPLLAKLAKQSRGSGQYVKRVIEKLPSGRAYFENDAETYDLLQTNEALSNTINSELLKRPECTTLWQKTEENLDHGIPHLRRVEKLKKTIDGKDPALLRDPNYLLFSLSSDLAIRLHDIGEIGTGEKKNHEALSALFSLGYLSRYDVAKRIMELSPKGNFIGENDGDLAERIAHATAFTCYYHSKPESMPSLQTLLEQGLVDPQALVAKVEEIAHRAGKPDIYGLMPEFSLISPQVEDMKNGTIKPLMLSEPLLEGCIKQALTISAADKFDSNYPPDLAATRMFLTKPNRSIYTRWPDPDIPLMEELKARIKDGGDMASCDFNRMLYEITRTGIFSSVSPWVSHAMNTMLRERAKFISHALPKLLEGNYDLFLDAYTREESVVIRKLLSKIGAVSNDIQAIDSKLTRRYVAEERIHEMGYKKELLKESLRLLNQERTQAMEIMEKKINGFASGNHDAGDIEHIQELIHLSQQLQQKLLRSTPGKVITEAPPYEGHFPPINPEPWKT